MTLEELILTEAFEGKEIDKTSLANLKAAIAKYINICNMWEKTRTRAETQIEIPGVNVNVTLNGKLDRVIHVAFPKMRYFHYGTQSITYSEANVELVPGPGPKLGSGQIAMTISSGIGPLIFPDTAKPEELEEVIQELAAAGPLTYLLHNAQATLPANAAGIRKTIVKLFNDPKTSMVFFLENAACNEKILKECADYLGAKFTTNPTPGDNWQFGTINCVLEGLIRRVAIAKVVWFLGHYGKEQFEKYITSVNTDPIYNVLDAGRNVFLKRAINRYNVPRDLTRELAYTEVSKTKYSLQAQDLLTALQQEFAGNVAGHLVTEADISNLILTKMRAAVAVKAKEEKLGKALEAIKGSLKEVSSGPKDGFTIINGMKVYKDRVEYDGEIFKADTIKSTEPFLTYMAATKSIVDLNFDMYLNQFLKRIQLNPSCKATIGAIDVNFEIRNTGKTNLSYINGYKISKPDVEQVLRQALCFEKEEDYEKFLKRVSQCSLKITNLLNNGIDLVVSSSRYASTSTVINLQVERDKNKHFLVLDEKSKFQISNINSLIRKDRVSLIEALNLLTDPKITTLTDRDIAMKLLVSGKVRQEDAVKKSEELLRNTEKVLKLQESNKVINGRTVKGYLIVGISGKEYFVDSSDTSTGAHGGHYPVYALPSGQALCIVDKASSLSQVGKDALVNRLFALKNDKLVAKHISTLGI